MKDFRAGGYNTLVSTCVGEEGLDIGEVDLIVCFDAHKSPTRLVQRMGRTGRKRDGRIVMLMTEGKEEQVLQNRAKFDFRIRARYTSIVLDGCCVSKGLQRQSKWEEEPSESNFQRVQNDLLLRKQSQDGTGGTPTQVSQDAHCCDAEISTRKQDKS